MNRYFSSILVLMVLLLAACGHEEDQDVIADEEEQDEANITPDLRVMTYNIHMANPPSRGDDVRDLSAVAKIINESGADLVALQEVDKFTIRSGIAVDQAEELGRLTDMKPYFAKAREIGSGDYGVAVLSKFPIIEAKGYQLPADPEVGGETRAISIIKVEVPGKGEIIFAGTHIDHSNENNRLYQGNKIIDILTSYDIPVILAGDFNAMPQSLTVDLFDNNFTRTCRLHCLPTFPAYNAKSAIDFIMFRPSSGFEVVSHKVIQESYASDHLPVIADLKIKQ